MGPILNLNKIKRLVTEPFRRVDCFIEMRIFFVILSGNSEILCLCRTKLMVLLVCVAKTKWNQGKKWFTEIV